MGNADQAETLLWWYKNCNICKKYDKEGCQKEYQYESKEPLDCNGMLIRLPWIPSYDKWKEKLGLASNHSHTV